MSVDKAFQLLLMTLHLPATSLINTPLQHTTESI